MKTLKVIYLFCFIITALFSASCEHEPELMPGTPEVCFDRDVMLIINSNCNVPDCHGSGGEASALATYDQVMKYVTSGKPTKSELYEVISANKNALKLMPPKPKSMLSSSQIDIINIWILQGAANTICP